MDSQLGTKELDITRLRNFVAAKLPPQSVLRDLLLMEKDRIPTGEFLARLPVYLALLRREEE